MQAISAPSRSEKSDTTNNKMGFKYLSPRSMFKRRTAKTDPSKKSKCADQGVDDSGRTCDVSLPEKLSLDDSFHIDTCLRLSSTTSGDSCAPSSPIEDLDACFHIPQDAHQDVLRRIQKRLSIDSRRCSNIDDSCRSRSSTGTRTRTRRQVSFLDQDLGLTPRHVVSQIHYRPQTTDEEKSKLYYNSKDFDIFEQEDLYEKIEIEIREIDEVLKKRLSDGQGDELAAKKVAEEMKILNLMRNMQHNRQLPV